MKLKDKLKEKKENLDQKINKLKTESEQMRAEKLRKNQKSYERGTIRFGLANKQSVKDFIKDNIKRRRLKREQKQKQE